MQGVSQHIYSMTAPKHNEKEQLEGTSNNHLRKYLLTISQLQSVYKS